MRPPRRSVRLAVEALERRLAPAVFNIPAGNTAALIAAINTANNNNEADLIELAAFSSYTFTAAADPADGGSALPTILRDTADANTLTIHGNGATLRRNSAAGTPQFRLIRTGVFPNNVGVIITDLTFANGDPGLGNGGAILLQAGDLALIRCTFTNNRADSGGAVYATTSTTPNRVLSMVDSTFTGNAATGLSPGGGGGGAVYSLGSTDVILEGDTFTLNTALRDGAALRVQTSAATITITDTLIATNTAGGGGGGILVQGTTTLTNSTVSDNLSGSSGGGVWVQAGGLTMTGSTVSGNRLTGSTAAGGGIFAQAAVTITNSTISDNTSAGGSGGIHAQGSLTMTGSTVSNNRADNSAGSGGGIFALGALSISNSTIHGNRAGNGGGIRFSAPSTISGSITHSTITDNRAFFALARGGGIQTGGDGPLSLGHTIVAGNLLEPSATSGVGPDISGPVTSLGYNLIQDTSDAVINGTTTGNVTGVAAGLGPLQDNGGQTFTRLPTLTSPARDAGDPAFVPPPATDQRDRPRVQNGRIDIGAAELAAVPTIANIQVNEGTAQRSMVRSITVTFSDRVSFAGGDANAAAAFTLSRIGGGGNVGLDATVSVLGFGQTVVTLTFTNANPAVIGQLSTQNGGPPSLANGRYQLTIADGTVTGEAGLLDGDGNGTAGGAYLSPPDTFGGGPGQLRLFRLCGDLTGNGVVDLADLAIFRQCFNTVFPQPGYDPACDFNNDGVVDLADLAQFRTCFNQTVFP